MYTSPITNVPDVAPYQRQANDLVDRINRLQQYGTLMSPYTPPAVAPHIDYVHGMDGAKKFLENMPAGGKAILMDEDEAKFYVVSKDANGTPAQIAFARFTLEFEQKPAEPMFVTKQDFDDFRTEMLEILSRRGDGA